jgi:hypothetical protein
MFFRRAMFLPHGCERQNYRPSKSAGGAFSSSFASNGSALNYGLIFS